MATHSNNIYADCILPLDEKMIRVLFLHPGDSKDEIQAELRLVEFYADPPPHYECLSYAWGSLISTQRAIINKQSILITENLDNALRHIRSTTEEVVIWADAICINQSDMDEKERQVALMSEIYYRCSRVYIWLGLPLPGSLTGNPFRFLEHFIQGRHFYDFPGFARNESIGRLTWSKNEACDNILDDMLQVVVSTWWTRAWTVPECILPNDTVIMFGTWTVTWDYILKAKDMKNDHGDGARKCCIEAINVFTAQQMDLINDWMWHAGWAERFRDVYHGNRPPPPPWFYEILLAFSSRECSEPRDKVYSLLSLAKHPVYRGFRPNYRADLPAVYTNTFTLMVQESEGSFSCFLGGGFGSAMKGLPSWVRDFSQIKPARVIAGEERRIWYGHRLYKASLAPHLSIRLIADKELHYRGTYADTIKAVGFPMNPPDTSSPNSNLGKIFQQWINLCKDVMGTCESSKLFRNTFSRIICGDVCKTLEEEDTQFRRARETDFPDEDAWHRFTKGDLNILDPRGYGWGLGFSMWGRCFFTTKSGRMGLCYPHALPEDEVWIFRGVQEPFVVRALEHADSGCAGRYTFVGDCFLDGIMDGELSERERLMERPIVMI